jgi:hypothetical protein
MESWRKVWREGFAPVLSTTGLLALRRALIKDDKRLIQGHTTSPPPLMCVQDWPVEAACALGFCGWQGEGLETVGEVEEFFARSCFEVDQILGEPADCRHFLNYWDDTPRGEARAELIFEIDLALAARQATVNNPEADTPALAGRGVGYEEFAKVSTEDYDAIVQWRKP